jgi:hypothetical protein
MWWGMFSKIHLFLHFQMHHAITIMISVDWGLITYRPMCRSEVYGGGDPIKRQHLLTKLHFRKRWGAISSFYSM